MSKINKEGTSKEVKKFDKKKWREKKYSNKFKVQQWENKRNKAVIKQYYKDKNNEPVYNPRLAPAHGEPDASSEPSHSSNQPKKKKMNCYKAAQMELERLKEEKQKSKQEQQKRKEEMTEALNKYKRKRMDRFKVISRKTARGQPSMSGRMIMLCDQIKQSLGCSTPHLPVSP